MDKKISQLTQTTSRLESDVIAIVNGGSTKKIAVEDFIREPLTDGGDVSGSFNVDLSTGHWFKFRLIGNVSVNFTNVKEGEKYLFWVYSNGNYAVNGMTIDGGSGVIYSHNGTLPNPANNAWNLYHGYAVSDTEIVLTELDNFSSI